MTPIEIADYECHTGEGPLWHPTQARLYWVDIPRGRLYRYDPATDEHGEIYRTDTIGGYTIEADGALALFGGEGSITRWDNGDTTNILDGIDGEENTRFNDVIADPQGRVFAGMMGTEDRAGRLYRIDPDGTTTVLLEGIGVPNGLGFSPDNTTLYFTDSLEKTIYRFDYDKETGAISNQEAAVVLDDGEGVPDGMTVDSEGNIWSAIWDGHRLEQFSPTGESIQEIAFPAKKVSSVCFGAPGFDTAYVTTAGGDDKPTEGDGAGAIFEVELDAFGRPDFRSRLGEGL